MKAANAPCDVWRKDKYPAEVDKGVVLAFKEDDGELLWQLKRDKLPIGRVSDWLLQGTCSVPVVEGKRTPCTHLEPSTFRTQFWPKASFTVA